eukprot:1715221-Ditylum_brightwellii.AAC.1
MESRQHKLDWDASVEMEAKLQSSRFSFKGDKKTKATLAADVRSMLQIQNVLLSSFSSSQKRIFLKWKNCTANGEKVSNKEIAQMLKQDNSDPEKGKKKCKRGKKSGAMKLWHTRAQTSDSTSEEVCLLMILDKESSDSDPTASLDGTRKVNANKVARASKSMARDNDTPFGFSTILDLGTEWTIAGRPA